LQPLWLLLFQRHLRMQPLLLLLYQLHRKMQLLLLLLFLQLAPSIHLFKLTQQVKHKK
jgi:hypothetical protein